MLGLKVPGVVSVVPQQRTAAVVPCALERAEVMPAAVMPEASVLPGHAASVGSSSGAEGEPGRAVSWRADYRWLNHRYDRVPSMTGLPRSRHRPLLLQTARLALQYENVNRLGYVRGPEGIAVGRGEQLS
ncbi:hypothetical protein OG937_01485 [Streptomyces sp. NBC_00510]